MTDAVSCAFGRFFGVDIGRCGGFAAMTGCEPVSAQDCLRGVAGLPEVDCFGVAGGVGVLFVAVVLVTLRPFLEVLQAG